MTANAAILDVKHWDEQYRAGDLPWETGRPSSELRRVLAEFGIRPCRAVELGCGTGANAVWLAARGFDVTAVDLSPRAVARARRRSAAGVRVRFRAADLIEADLPGGPFDFFFDRGCYHAVRRADAAGYHHALRRFTRPGSVGLVLMGNDREPEDAVGPPVVGRREIRDEWGTSFTILRLREFRFDAARPGDIRYLGWSCLVRRDD